MQLKMRLPTLFYFLITGGLLIVQTVRAQNLLINPSFEETNICTEYHAPCAPVGWENVAPAFKMRYGYHGYSNGAGRQHIWLLSGATSDERNYAQTRLLCPLVKGKQYRLKGIRELMMKSLPQSWTYTCQKITYSVTMAAR